VGLPRFARNDATGQTDKPNLGYFFGLSLAICNERCNNVESMTPKNTALEKKYDFVADEIVKKLILLFIFEKMEFPLTDESVNEIVVHNPEWMTYMDYCEAINKLIESKFVYRTTVGVETSFSITQDGRGALGHFYHKVPASIREEITAFAKEHRGKFKRKQEYTWDYYKNADDRYTVVLRIRDHLPGENLLEIKFKTDTRMGAKSIANIWREKASLIYETIYNMTTPDSPSEENKGEE
jgi:hypothetical protein